MPELLRTLRLRDLLLLFVGPVIGSGIFRTPGPILHQVDGSVALSLLVWLVGGVLSLLGALTYAELAAANPEGGGLYCYILADRPARLFLLAATRRFLNAFPVLVGP
jgi:APA family basic amino acid/polyamine antiporter